MPTYATGDLYRRPREIIAEALRHPITITNAQRVEAYEQSTQA